MLGLAGVAFLYVRDGIDSQRVPELTGWFGRVNPFAFDPNLVDYPTTARRFEGGTPAVPAVYAANAGLELLGGVDQVAAYQHVVTMTDRLADGLTAGGARISRSADSSLRGPQVALYDDAPETLSAWLHERRIMTAARGQLVRMSVHYYSTAEDIDTAIAAVLEYQGR
jgi:selenocysteine lyase/cysteine desulfurase